MEKEEERGKEKEKEKKKEEKKKEGKKKEEKKKEEKKKEEKERKKEKEKKERTAGELIDLTKLFEAYNGVMSSMSKGLLEMAKIYEILNTIGDSVGLSDSEEESLLPGKIRSEISPFVPVLLDSYKFEDSDSVRETVELMNARVARFSEVYEEIIGVNEQARLYLDRYDEMLARSP